MPPGTNGPWQQAETPLRNTGYWLATFLHAHNLTGEGRFLRAASRAADYMGRDEHRPGGAAFWNRVELHAGPANGLIGQAWTFEALLAAAHGLGRDDLHAVAVEVFLQHRFHWGVGLWETLEVDGRGRGVNLTFNQQVWFAAMAARLDCEPGRRRAGRFLNCLPRLLQTWRSGLIIHRLTVRGLLPHLVRHPGILRRIWIRVRWPLAVRAVGYHSFVLAGLAQLHECFPTHRAWRARALARCLRYARSEGYRSSLGENPFAFGYNPTGLELAYALRELGGASGDEVDRWFAGQMERAFDPSAGLMIRGAPDPETLAARVYEAGHLIRWSRPGLAGSPQSLEWVSAARDGSPADDSPGGPEPVPGRMVAAAWPAPPAAQVSVIVPVLDNPLGLRACLEALEAQDYPPDRFEVLVVDNGSREPLDDLLEAFPHAALLREPRPGSYAARNRGLERAVGDVLAFTDADCLPRADWLRRGVEALDPARGRHVVAGRVEMFAQDPEQPTLAELYELILGFPQDVWVRRDGFAATANLMALRAVVDAVGAFRSDLRSGGDSEWCRRARRAGFRMAYLPNMVIAHPARRSLAELIQRARRIAGGSVVTHGRKLRRILRSQLRDLRPPRWATLRILADPRPGAWDRVQLIAIACLLRLVRVAERVRVYCGGEPLR